MYYLHLVDALDFFHNNVAVLMIEGDTLEENSVCVLSAF